MQDKEGTTPVHTSKMSGLHSISLLCSKMDIIDLLSIKDIKGNTGLHLALAEGSVEWISVACAVQLRHKEAGRTIKVSQ